MFERSNEKLRREKKKSKKSLTFSKFECKIEYMKQYMQPKSLTIGDSAEGNRFVVAG